MHLQDIRPGDSNKGEIHGAAYCASCNGIIVCELCPRGEEKMADVLTPRFYLCYDHGDAAFEEDKT